MEGVQNFDYGVKIDESNAVEYLLMQPIKAIRVNGPFTITKGVKNVESCDDGYIVLDIYGNPHAMHHREFEATYRPATPIKQDEEKEDQPPATDDAPTTDEGSEDDADDPSGL